MVTASNWAMLQTTDGDELRLLPGLPAPKLLQLTNNGGYCSANTKKHAGSQQEIGASVLQKVTALSVSTQTHKQGETHLLNDLVTVHPVSSHGTRNLEQGSLNCNDSGMCPSQDLSKLGGVQPPPPIPQGEDVMVSTMKPYTQSHELRTSSVCHSDSPVPSAADIIARVPLKEIQTNAGKENTHPLAMSDPVTTRARSTIKGNVTGYEVRFGRNRAGKCCPIETEAASESAGRTRDKERVALEIDLSPYFLADNCDCRQTDDQLHMERGRPAASQCLLQEQDQYKDHNESSEEEFRQAASQCLLLEKDQHKNHSESSKEEFWSRVMDVHQTQKRQQISVKEGTNRKLSRHRFHLDKGNWESRIRRLKRRARNTGCVSDG